uniref:Interleukin 1 receptor like 2 n=1 Tax=Chrysemys picta bellii TaxID=8478 RepID=A0A8C3FJ57_CHRPI
VHKVGFFKNLFSCFSFCLPLEECEVYDVFLKHNFVHEGQPLAVNCSVDKILNFKNTDYNLTWYKTGSQTSVSKDKHSRIHQQKNFIWFLPATLDDSGSYECVISCRKIYMNLRVFKNIYGLCFNEEFAIGEEILTSSHAKVVCPHLDYFRDEENTLPLQWYKKDVFLQLPRSSVLLEEERFVSFNDYLVIKNATLHDKGNYTCRTSYTYKGKQYNISRDIRLTVTVSPRNTPPEIFYPRNNTIEVELGKQVFLQQNNNVYPKQNLDSRGFPSAVCLVISSFTAKVPLISKLDKFCNFFFFSFTDAVADFHKSLTGGFIALLLLTVVTLLIFKLFKIDIVLWYRSSCCAFLKKEASDGKIYDAYVMYPKPNGVRCVYTLNNFALRILPEVLESQCGYNLFILGRDDLLGEAVVNVIDETIKRSRRLMIILESEASSYNVLEDTFEQQLAVYNALIRDEIKIILIELDKIQDNTNMPESIKYIKQKYGAIQWKGDFTEKSHSANTKFWKNVRYRMPPRQTVFSLDPKTFRYSAATER